MASIMVKYSMVKYIIIILLNHYLLFYLTILPYRVPDTLLGTGDTTVRDTYKVPALRECTFPPLLFPIQHGQLCPQFSGIFLPPVLKWNVSERVSQFLVLKSGLRDRSAASDVTAGGEAAR